MVDFGASVLLTLRQDARQRLLLGRQMFGVESQKVLTLLHQATIKPNMTREAKATTFG